MQQNKQIKSLFRLSHIVKAQFLKKSAIRMSTDNNIKTQYKVNDIKLLVNPVSFQFVV